jgi:hypothetical protein
MSRAGGFTFVEVLFSTLILSLVIGGIYGVVSVGNMTYDTDLGLLDLQQNARRAMAWMVRELREGIGPGINPTSVAISSGGSQISFDTPNESGIIYYLDSNNDRLIRQYQVSQITLANNISNLNFCCWHSADDTCTADCSDSLVVRIQLSAFNTVRQRDLPVFSLTEKIRLRNEI